MLHITVSEKGHQINTVLPSWYQYGKKKERKKGALTKGGKHKSQAHG